jgi:hypothetical protein
VYDVPKESAAHVHTDMAAPQGGEPNPHAGMAMGQPQIKVPTLPEDWLVNPNPGAMRAASFLVTNSAGGEAEVAAIPMPGMADIELQLVNMWREQAKQPAITEAELGTQSVPVTIGDGQGKLFEVASTEPVLGGTAKARILVAMLKQPGTTWFFKFTGEDQLVASNKEKFLQFLKGVSFEAPAAMPPGHPPMAGAGTPGMGMGGMMGGGSTVPPGTGEHPDWKVPTGWTEVAHSSFLTAKFQTTGEGGSKAEINVSMSPGDGGGLMMNVTRWRGQLSLGPLDEPGLAKAVTTFEVGPAKATMVDFSGEGAENGEPLRCVGIMVTQANGTWFFKLMGSASVVGREKDALVQFVRSVKF